MPITSVGKQAIVVGAGIAGLTAAKALSGYFDKVIVLERDVLPVQPVNRVGTPQSPHIHLLLGGGCAALEQLCPGFLEALLKAGAVPLRAGFDLRIERPGFDPFPQRDLGWMTYSSTRALLEFVLRGFVRRVENIVIHDACRAVAVLTDDQTGRVNGLRLIDANGIEKEMGVDLVVDASSRGVLTSDALKSLKLPVPVETEIGVDIMYATGIFKIPNPSPVAWKAVLHASTAPDNGRGGLLVPIEENRWCIGLTGKHGEIPPLDIEGFAAYAKSFRTPTIYNAICSAELLGVVRRFGLPSSLRRHFEKLSVFPRGLLAIGDLVCRFNPGFGQGMSVAAQEAVILRDLLSSRLGKSDPLDGLAQSFFDAIQECLAAPWGVAESDFVFPQTRGVRPADFEKRMAYSGSVFKIAAGDPEVHKLFIKVQHLLAKASELRAPELAARVSAL